MNNVWAILAGQPNTLLSFDEIKEKLRIGGQYYFMGIDQKRDVTEEEAVAHQHYLGENQGQPLTPPRQAARDYINHQDD